LSPFSGLSAFPLTPCSPKGRVDLSTFSLLVDRLADAGLCSVGVLGSTGAYAYLDRAERQRAAAAAIEAADGRVPIIVNVGAHRTDWAQELVLAAEKSGADGLLMAPVSYTSLAVREVAAHFAAVAGCTGLPLCIYNNPGTTNFHFSPELLSELSMVAGIKAVKMPLPDQQSVEEEIGELRQLSASTFEIGYSGDWGCGSAVFAGADAWYSVIAGLLPLEAQQIMHAGVAREADRLAALNDAFEPMWKLFRTHGSFRVVYTVADLLGFRVGEPPRPIQGLDPSFNNEVDMALNSIQTGAGYNP
jgi:4-hydroxy-tetrahydrodipicolinate synthase